ncbi:MAG: DUF2283 domain-containing protein [SAR324 cluster bacterium]|nr:DUF2283 domain-containing protein [SAR324 cluster bacterium]
MKIEYFEDTDTVQVTFNENSIVDTKDIDENILAEFDEKGHLVSITVEHAQEHTNLDSFIYQKVS